MQELSIKSIGKILINEEGTYIKLDSKYIEALEGLDKYSHVNIFWWFNGYASEEWRNKLKASPPYKNAPKDIGTFATRSPKRPNPIAFSVSPILNVDHENGIIKLAYIDAYDNSPVLDIKPYSPSLDRVENPIVPTWCNHWPKSVEACEKFDWANESIVREWDNIKE